MKRRKLKNIVKIIILLILIVALSIGIFFLIKYDRGNNLENDAKEVTYTYESDSEFMEYVNSYLQIGYTRDEIEDIYKLSSNNQIKLLSKDKIDFNNYIGISNFNIDNIDRYNSYYEENDYDYQTVVTYVNLNLDKEYYTDSELIENPSDITTLVNKYHHVSEDYVPDNLVTLCDSTTAQMVDVAAEAYELLIAASVEAGLTIQSTTAYRSYSYQSYLYNYYVSIDGEEKADTYSARPGSSEHQLGLAVDLNDPNVSGSRLNDEDYAWLQENSYKYGFIIRYTADNESITGYMEEPWHLRYLGVELATKVYESGLTYDEYYDLYLTEY